MILYRPLEAAPGTLRFKLYHLGSPVTLSDSLPMLEHMGLKVLDERPYRVDARRLATDLDARLRHAIGDSSTRTSRSMRCTQSSRTRSGAFSAAKSRTTTSIGWYLPRGFRPTRSSSCAPTRSTCGRSASPLSQSFIETTLAAHSGIARVLVELFKMRFDPDASHRRRRARGGQGASNRGRARERRESVGGPRAAPIPGADPGDDAHQLLAAATPPGSGADLPVVQVRSGEGAGPARAEADVRDLRLLAALRRRAPARRQGRARRLALVRPAGGFPHRGAGARQGADGQEHGHRAGRLEGRLRAEARAARSPIARRT